MDCVPQSPQAPAQSVVASADHAAALLEAQRMASFFGAVPSSAHLLLALLRVGGAAARLLHERGVTPARLEAHHNDARPEGAAALPQLEASSHDIARDLGARQTTSLHLLLAILRTGGAGMDLLRLTGHEPARVRSLVMRALTGPGRFGERSLHRGSAGAVSAVPSAAVAQASWPSLAIAGVSSPSARAPALGASAARASRPEQIAARPLSETGALQSASAQASTAVTSSDFALELRELAPLTRPLVGRERELGRLLDLLATNSGRIVCIVGDSGTGRSTLLEALCTSLPHPPALPSSGPGPSSGGTAGAWVESMHAAAPADMLLAIDGCDSLGGEGSDGPSALVAAAKSGRQWILLATSGDLRRFELFAPELAARLETVPLAPLEGDALVEAVQTGLGAVAKAHGIEFPVALARVLVRLSPRYPCDRAQPGRALTIADVAAARAAREQKNAVDEASIAGVVADAAQVPRSQLLRTDDERFKALGDKLGERVVGHDAARTRIAELLQRSYAGFRSGRPLASILLLGPTGVGKTETARAIACALFDSEKAMVRIDLSEFNEAHAVSRLIGSPPGYVGHEQGGQLTEAVRQKPATVVLLDEFEKAHREVLLLLLQILEDGRLSDGRGRLVDFTSATIVMTSNLGSELYKRSRTPPEKTVMALARTRLPAELWNRIDEILCYGPLSDDELRQIVARIARASSARLQAERNIAFSVDDSLIEQVLHNETDRSLGARPLRRAFERMIEGPIAGQILQGRIRSGSRLQLSCRRDGRLQMRSLS